MEIALGAPEPHPLFVATLRPLEVAFAHGDVFMVGAFIALIVIIAIGLVASTSFALTFLALILVLIIAMAIGGPLGGLVARMRPYYDRTVGQHSQPSHG